MDRLSMRSGYRPPVWDDPELGKPRGDASTLFNLRLPGDDDPRRQEVRRWLVENPDPTPLELYEAGYMVPAWPEPYGRGASGTEVLIIDEELRNAGIVRPEQGQRVRGYMGPLILNHGTPEQIEKYLVRMLSFEDRWCQLFSEPEAGSDLASLTTRAELQEDHYVVNGAKTWASGADHSEYGLLLARTSRGDRKHQGISLFILDMSTPGIHLDPVYNVNGHRGWNIAYFDDVRVPVENRIGPQDDGWAITRNVLANERLSMSSLAGLIWGMGPTFEDMLTYARQIQEVQPLAHDVRERLAQGFIEATALHVMRVQALGSVGQARSTDLVPEVRRTLIDDNGQSMLELWRDLHGASGVLNRPPHLDDVPGASPVLTDAFTEAYPRSRVVTIGGGTGEIQRNILAEYVLGLPRN